MQPSGVGAQILGVLAQAGTGVETISGVGNQTLASLTQIGTGVIFFSGIGAQTLGALAQLGTGTQSFIGIGAQVLGILAQAGTGVVTLSVPTFVAEFIAILQAADIGISAFGPVSVVNSSEIIVNLGRDTGV